MFTDSAADYDTVQQIIVFPLTPNTTLETGESFVWNGFNWSGDAAGYYLLAAANGKINSNMDTAYVGIKFPSGQVDTLTQINQLDASLYDIVKCLYNGVVKFDIIPGESLIRGDTVTAIMYPTIEVEKE